jgi:hypothetical protein
MSQAICQPMRHATCYHTLEEEKEYGRNSEAAQCLEGPATALGGCVSWPGGSILESGSMALSLPFLPVPVPATLRVPLGW